VTNQSVGNLPPLPGIFPDYPAPAVRNARRNASSMRAAVIPFF